MSSKSAIPFMVFGACLMGLVAVSIFFGYVPLRYSGGIRLDEQPAMFWLGTAVYFVAGLILIGVGVWRFARR